LLCTPPLLISNDHFRILQIDTSLRSLPSSPGKLVLLDEISLPDYAFWSLISSILPVIIQFSFAFLLDCPWLFRSLSSALRFKEINISVWFFYGFTHEDFFGFFVYVVL
jgi:hypothetical protein